jgi:phosphohistidine swiveling domain-containing protein
VKQIVEDILRSNTDPKDPDSAARAQFEQFSAEERRIVEAIRGSIMHRVRFARRFRKRLHLARLYLSRREEMREYSTRAYNVVRRYVIEAGRRLQRMKYLDETNDVFMLQTQELVGIGCNGDDQSRIRTLAQFRRLMYRGYSSFDPPGEVGRDIAREPHPTGIPTDSDSLTLRGIGCSSGIVKAVVRVVPTLDQAASLKPGEILVTRFTDPGWTPVLGLVSGIVTEVGGLLSHAAVIGREYGIPAVLNVAGATHVLTTGQLVEIDGNEGTVKILKSGCNE